MGTVIYILILGWVLVMGFLTVTGSREEKTKKYIKIMVGVLIFLLISNILLTRTGSEYKEYLLQRELENSHHIWVIALHVEYIAEKIDVFLSSLDEMEQTGDIPDKLYSRWNAVLMQSDDLSYHTGRISYEHLGDVETNWRELEYILSRLKNTLFALNEKCLERCPMVVTPQEREKLEAIAAACRIIHKSVEIRPALKFEAGLLETLGEYMFIIDPYYSKLSER